METMHCAQSALVLYAALDDAPTPTQELSLPSFIIGAPLTQPLTNRATEALCFALLAIALIHDGQVHNSIRNGRRALALAQESKSAWVQVTSTTYLVYGLLEAGAYEEALVLTQHVVALVRTLPPTANAQRFLTALGSTYQALQQWEAAQSTLEEAAAIAETLSRGSLHVPVLMRLGMNCALAGKWEQVYLYAVQAITLRKRRDVALIVWDFYHQYEIEALLRGGDERLAREEVQRLGQTIGPNRRFRVPYLQALAILATWEGKREQAISHLREAVELASAIGLPGEQWQIQAALGKLYEVEGAYKQASMAYAEATILIQGLAERIQDEALRARFLSGRQIHAVLQHAHRLATSIPDDHTEPSGL